MSVLLTEPVTWLREGLGTSEPVVEPETEQVRHRRRVVVLLTAMVGGVLTGFALNQSGTGVRFFVLTFALAATWIVGALLSGPLHLGARRASRDDLVRPVVLAAIAFLVFLAGDLVVRPIPWLHHQVQDVIGHASGSALALAVVVAIVNGLGEELFFRGAVYTTLEAHRPEVTSTVAYLAVIACAGTPILLVAGLVMGSLFALERRATRGVLASSITHVAWSMLMIALLPR